MANFFKDYHQELKATRKAEEQAEWQARLARQYKPEYHIGQPVYIYAGSALMGGKVKRYFAGYGCTDNMVWLSATKSEAFAGIGHTYYTSEILN